MIERDGDGFVIMDLLPDGESDAGYVEFPPPPPLAGPTWQGSIAEAIDAEIALQPGGVPPEDLTDPPASDADLFVVDLDHGAADAGPPAAPDDGGPDLFW